MIVVVNHTSSSLLFIEWVIVQALLLVAFLLFQCQLVCTSQEQGNGIPIEELASTKVLLSEKTKTIVEYYRSIKTKL